MSPTELSRRLGLAYPYNALSSLLILLAVGSAGVGVRNALHQSQDFQWSAARLLDMHVDPWAVYLDGDPHHLLIASQIPNYLPVLYLLMSPLGVLPQETANLVWALCNVAFAIVSSCMAARFYGLQARGVAIVVCLFLMATATRTAIGNGQQALLILCFWSLSLFRTRMSPPRAQLAGISYAKFSFAPPLFFYLLFRREFAEALLSLTPIVGGALIVWIWLTAGHTAISFERILREPFAVARTGFRDMPGDQNLMSLIQSLLGPIPEHLRLPIALSIATAVCAAVSWWAFRVHRTGSVQWQLAVMATMSFSLFNHHSYDGVVLLLPLCYALRHRYERRAQVVLALLAYLFYLQRIVEALHLHRVWMRIPECVMLVGVLTLTCRMKESDPATVLLPDSVEIYPEVQEVALASFKAGVLRRT